MIDIWFLFWVGLIFGLITDKIWMAGVLPDKRIAKTGFGWLTWIEHYHWAFVMGILYGRFLFVTVLGYTIPLVVLLGFGTALLLGEHFQDHPYAYKSGHFWQSTVIGALLLLVTLLVLRQHILLP